MRAQVGDWLIVKGRTESRPTRRGEITAVSGADGAPPFTVHWLDTDRTGLVFPGPDATVLTGEEMADADRQAAQRVERVQQLLSDR